MLREADHRGAGHGQSIAAVRGRRTLRRDHGKQVGAGDGATTIRRMRCRRACSGHDEDQCPEPMLRQCPSDRRHAGRQNSPMITVVRRRCSAAGLATRSRRWCANSTSVVSSTCDSSSVSPDPGPSSLVRRSEGARPSDVVAHDHTDAAALTDRTTSSHALRCIINATTPAEPAAVPALRTARCRSVPSTPFPAAGPITDPEQSRADRA